ncbi:hypothetical protein [Streptomyces canus]
MPDRGLAATEDTGMDEDATVDRHREPGMDLPQVESPVRQARSR